MNEKRKEKRLVDENEVGITVFADGKKFAREKVFYNYSKDISPSGARIQSNTFLPVNTLLKMDVKLKILQQVITVIGKVRWIKSIFGDEYFDAGVEFVDVPMDAMKTLVDYMSLKQKYSMY